MKKKIIIAIIIIAIIILVFVLIREKTMAPANETQINVQSEVDKLGKVQRAQTTEKADTNANVAGSAQGVSTQPTNNVNNNPMQLEIKTTQPGTGDRTVKSGDTVDVYYTGKLTDGKVFDSNVGSGKPFEFTVGAGMVIQGWEQGFIGAKIGEKRTLTIPSDLGYGAQGAGGVIPPNATLIFDVELVSIK
jgi:FKBP-type peptidyl-prolyl cis-trans isomerase